MACAGAGSGAKEWWKIPWLISDAQRKVVVDKISRNYQVVVTAL